MDFTLISYQQAVEVIEREYTDNLGIIVQRDGDRGDSASRVGIYYYLRILNETDNKQELSETFHVVLDKLEIQPGIYVRHPDDTYSNGTPVQSYVNNPSGFSRDQQTPIQIAMGEYPLERSRLQRLFAKQLSRLGTYQNKDIGGPETLSIYFRSLNSIGAYPVDLLGDVELLVNSLIRLGKRKANPDDTSDDVNHCLALIQAYYRYPTPISLLARQVYKLSNPMQALESYFRFETNAPPMAELFRPQMRKIGLTK